jgi:UDP-N-acetylmuramyl-tripeptide synthetase
MVEAVLPLAVAAYRRGAALNHEGFPMTCASSASVSYASQIVTTLGHYIDLLDSSHLLATPVAANINRAARIAFVTCDSREVVSDTLFICKGAAFKEEYLLSSIEAGAVAYVADHPFAGSTVPGIIVTDVRAAMGALADAAYDHPSGKLNVCAFTGTKGKTTSAFYLKGILDARAAREGSPSAPILSTILTNDGTGERPAHLTTPEPLELQRHLANAVANGATDMVMEASSQALKYGRVAHVDFAVGAFTNISEDHISPIEHPTFEDYFASKLLIFKQSRVGVINLDMDFVDRVLDAAREAPMCERVVTYSFENPRADVYLSDVTCEGGHLAAKLHTPHFACELTLPTAATFNAANALGAICCALELGATENDIVRGLANVTVPGRMEIVEAPVSGVTGIVDYAHNAVSLDALLTSVRTSYPDRELTVVFGSTGVKGLDRREGMGKVAGLLADRIFITEDDEGTEPLEPICQTIAHFVKDAGNTHYKIVLNREEAIGEAVATATRPAVIVVAGKGHELRMLRANGPEPYPGDANVLSATFEKLFD